MNYIRLLSTISKRLFLINQRTTASSNLLQKRLLLLTSKDCSLCVHFKQQLDSHLSSDSSDRFTIEQVDINCIENATYASRYRFDIPVLLNGDDDRLILKHYFDREKFEQFFD
jgi:hypothetical protein